MNLLAEFSLYFLTLHVLAVIVGMGGATVSDILFFKFLQDYRISKKEVEVLHVLKDVVMGAIIMIIVSGLLLYVPATDAYNASPMFLLKATIVGVVTLNGIALHMFVAPRLLELDLHHKDTQSAHYRYFAFALGAVSVTSWYSAFFIAMLKTKMLFTYTQGLIGYCILLACALIGSQIMAHILVCRACKQS